MRRLSCSLIGLALAIDGDTLQIAAPDGCRVRLWGVDAPELHEAYGPEAAAALASVLAEFGTVSCAETHGTSFERTVARCLSTNGDDVAAELVRRGWAADSPAYSSGAYSQAEAEARAAGRGMWAE